MGVEGGGGGGLQLTTYVKGQFLIVLQGEQMGTTINLLFQLHHRSRYTSKKKVRVGKYGPGQVASRSMILYLILICT